MRKSKEQKEAETIQPDPGSFSPVDKQQNDVPISLSGLAENLTRIRSFFSQHPEVNPEILHAFEDIRIMTSNAMLDCASLEDTNARTTAENIKLREKLSRTSEELNDTLEMAHQLGQMYNDQIENQRSLGIKHFTSDSEASKNMKSADVDFSEDENNDDNVKKTNEVQKLIGKIEDLHKQHVNPPKESGKADSDDENVASGAENYNVNARETYKELEKERIEIFGLDPEEVEKDGVEKAIQKAHTRRTQGYREQIVGKLPLQLHYFNANGEEVSSAEQIDPEIKMNGVILGLAKLEQHEMGIDIIPAHGERIVHFEPVYRVVGMEGVDGKLGRCDQEEFDRRKINVQRILIENGSPMRVEGLNVAVKNTEARANGHEEEVKNRKTTKGDVFVKTRPVEKFINKSYVTPVLLATLLTLVFYLGLPVTRLATCSSQVTLGNIFVPTSVLYHWISMAYYKKLIYIIPLMQKVLLLQKYLHADETSFRVLNGDNKKGYVWVYATIASCATPVILYSFAPGRSGDFAAKFLIGWQGHLITDAYAGYNAVVGAIHCFCLIHSRRKFYEAATCGVSTQSKSLGNKIVVLFDHMFEIERSLKDLTPEERVKQRNEKIKPILELILKYCNQIVIDPHISQGGKLAKAARYFINNYTALTKCLMDGNIPLHNMVSEHAIKHIALYRKNSLFCVSQKSGEVLAGIMSVIFTAKANGLDPFAYLVFLFENMKGDCFDEEFLATLLPWSEKAQNACKAKQALNIKNLINLVGGGIAA